MALNAVDLTLPINYRCAPNILGHAAKLIAHNSNRAAKNIKAHKEIDGEVTVRRMADRDGELDVLAKPIKEQSPIGEWAVLGRTNALLDLVEVSLRSQGIEIKRSGGKSIWENGIGNVFAGIVRSICTDTWMGLAAALSYCGAPSSWVNEHSRSQGGTALERLGVAIQDAPDDQVRKVAVALREGFISWSHQAISKDRANLVVFGIVGFLNNYGSEGQRGGPGGRRGAAAHRGHRAGRVGRRRGGPLSPAVGVKAPGQAGHGGALQRLVHRHGGQQPGKALRQHGFARTGRTHHQEAMATSSVNLQRAARSRPSLHVGQVRRTGGGAQGL